jgi:hypothetical protein
MTLVEKVTWRGKVLEEYETKETCTVMTRRVRWFFITRSHTTVLPGPDCDSTQGFIVWWNSDDPIVLESVHSGMVEVVKRIGFTAPAIWCETRHEHRSRNSLNYFWEEQLGELFRHYKKAT